MKLFTFAGVLLALALSHVLALPVKESSSTEKPSKIDEESSQQNLENVIEYERYLKEVVGLLESDKEFRKKLDAASEVDIRTGKIAQELELVDHQVRSKLDELKRTELERLRGLAREYYERTNEIDREHLKIAEHLDHENEHTFEIEDLKKLIIRTGEDLAEADRQRREDFKQYELQKEFEKQEKLRGMKEEEKKQFEAKVQEMTEKHNKHEKVHHPGSKDQLEEVWEKQDHMDPTDFEPRKFFMLHDLDGNGFWDEMEVKALFKTELDKVYQQGLPEDDMRERAEEMERMREHVYKEADVNHDRLISFDEFMEQTKKREFQQDEGWDTVDQQTQYTHDEYLEFERRRQEEINRLIAEGRLPPHPNMPGGYYPDQNAHYQVPMHPNEIPQNYHPNSGHQQYPPPQQYHAPPPNQQQNYHYQQPNAIPVQQHQEQMKQQYQEQQRLQHQVNQQMGQQHQQPNAHPPQPVANQHPPQPVANQHPPQQQQQQVHQAPPVQQQNYQPPPPVQQHQQPQVQQQQPQPPVQHQQQPQPPVQQQQPPVQQQKPVQSQPQHH